jgi:Lipocalin-like domain
MTVCAQVIIQEEDKMDRRVKGIRLVAALLFLGGALPTSNALGQAKSLKDQLVGAWALVSFESFSSAGTKVPAMEGSDLKGRLILTENGLLSVQMIAEYPKLASKDRLNTTVAEDKAVAHGVLSFFGTYTIDEADKLIIFHIERSSFPNQATGKGAKRTVTLSGDELRLGSPGQTTGGQRRFVIVWKRMK